MTSNFFLNNMLTYRDKRKKGLAAFKALFLFYLTCGIGASANCSGQILVTEDILGLTNFNAKFVKKYIDLNKKIKSSIRKFSIDVKSKKYPQKKHLY